MIRVIAPMIRSRRIVYQPARPLKCAPIVPCRLNNKDVRQLEERVRELERQLGRKTLEAEILREALDKSTVTKPTFLARSPLKGDFR